ncbi:hypothetical protein OB920_20325 [Halobacteria archaeon HArc-gm2]|nr:hypothetical protein [Halobacteria archaeon HArc-gm2]
MPDIHLASPVICSITRAPAAQGNTRKVADAGCDGGSSEHQQAQECYVTGHLSE